MKKALPIAQGKQFIVATGNINFWALFIVLTLNDTHMHKALISKWGGGLLRRVFFLNFDLYVKFVIILKHCLK